MKDGYIHICFVIDESGSMYSSKDDVIGSFRKMVDEQKEVKDGKCTVSVFTFSTEVCEKFIGADINSISSDLEYNPGGLTAMNDGIGTAIDKIGKWLSDMDEDERPSKNLIVIMTDGEENNSKEYTIERVKEMIRHQKEKYSWDFVFVGMDVTDDKYANNLGIETKMYTSKDYIAKNYEILCTGATMYRSCNTADASDRMMAYISCSMDEETKKYNIENGLNLS